METATVFMNGRSQAVRIPQKFRFDTDEVCIQKLGSAILLTPKDSLWSVFCEGLNEFSDDFMEDGRCQSIEPEREML